MKRIKITSIIATSIVSLNVHAQSAERPNIVFILMDDLGWSDLGCYGSSYYQTPSIDKLAEEGILFTSAYAMPTSSPSRAALMSGKYPPKTNVYTVDGYARTPNKMRKYIPPTLEHYLREDEYLMSEMIKDAGYTNGHFGKWHLGNTKSTYPLGQGFDINIAGCESGAPKSFFAPYKNIKNIPDQEEGTYLTDVLMDGALKFIEENKANPFFLYFPFYEVHVPLHVKKEWVDKFKNKQGYKGQNVPEYAAMLAYADHCVGRLMASLKELGLEDNTIVVITSDNGGQIMVTDNAPLRGQKGNLYEGGIRVPLIVKWPNEIASGGENDTPISIIDYYPTFAEILGVKEVEQELDGESFYPLLVGNRKMKRKSIFWHMPSYNGNLNANSALFQAPASVIRKGDWKLIENLEDGSLELYNLKEDISETNDLSKVNKARTKELLKDLRRWRKELNAPMPTQLNPSFEVSSREDLNKSNVRNTLQTNRLIKVK